MSIKDPEMRRWFASNADALRSASGKGRREALKWVAANKAAAVEPTKPKEFKSNTKAFWQGQSFGPASPVRKVDPSSYKPDKG